MSGLLYEQESFLIRRAIYEVYRTFRNRHKEVVYHNSLQKLLFDYHFQVEKNKHIPVIFRNIKVGTYVPDLVVNDSIIIELKCKPFILKEDKKQFWEYLKATIYKLGFLVNFGAPNGVEIARFVYERTRG